MVGVYDLEGGGLGDAIRESFGTAGPAVFCCCLFFNYWRPSRLLKFV